MAETAIANADQVAYWNAAAGETWTAMHDKLDGQIQPLGEAAMEALGLKAGDRDRHPGAFGGRPPADEAQPAAWLQPLEDIGEGGGRVFEEHHAEA